MRGPKETLPKETLPEETLLDSKHKLMGAIFQDILEKLHEPGYLLSIFIMIEQSKNIAEIISIQDRYDQNGVNSFELSGDSEKSNINDTRSRDVYVDYKNYHDDVKSKQKQFEDLLKAQIEAEKRRIDSQNKARIEAEKRLENKLKIAQLKKERKDKKIAYQEKLKLEKEALEQTNREIKEAEERARFEAEERARVEAEERAKIKAEEQAKKIEEKQQKDIERQKRYNDRLKSQPQPQPQHQQNEPERKGNDKKKSANESREEARRKNIEKSRQIAEQRARIQAEEKARIEAEEKEKARIEAEEKEKETAEKKALKAKIAQERKERYEKAKTIKTLVIEKGQENFAKFQPFFDFLRKKKFLDIGEIGLFGSRVYTEALKESFPARVIVYDPNRDFDFYCVPKSTESSGIFAICPDEISSKEYFSQLLAEFNEKNPNIQISFLKDRSKKSVNYARGEERSLNFKLVATIFEDKVDGDKSEKIIKEQIDFDFNFYTQNSALTRRQWQIGMERPILIQDSENQLDLKLNDSNCTEVQRIKAEKFFFELSGPKGEDFLTELNPKAEKFLDRILNKKGIYKYLSDEELNIIKTKLVEEHRPLLEKELQECRRLSMIKITQKNKFREPKKIESQKILDLLKKDPILITLEYEIFTTPQSPSHPNANQVQSCDRAK
jgi:hypothetical protein